LDEEVSSDGKLSAPKIEHFAAVEKKRPDFSEALAATGDEEAFRQLAAGEGKKKYLSKLTPVETTRAANRGKKGISEKVMKEYGPKGYKVDSKFIGRFEYMHSRTIKPSGDKAGGTNFMGVDYGSKKLSWLEQLPASIRKKYIDSGFTGIFNKKGKDAKDWLEKNQDKIPVFTDKEMEIVSAVAMKEEIEAIAEKFGEEKFKKLSGGVQTAIGSFSYNHGAPGTEEWKWYKKIKNDQDYIGAVNELNIKINQSHRPKWWRERRSAERDLIISSPEYTMQKLKNSIGVGVSG